MLTLRECAEIWEANCWYCGEPPRSKRVKKGWTYLYNGIDRIDNNKGYVPGNSISCCKYCNRAKNDRSSRLFFMWIEKVYNKHF
jgi:hypothetical protein